jgi:hypothetical protein
MLASEPRNDETRIEPIHGGLCGDFARGQRAALPGHPTKPCDFATGLRHREAVPMSGDFATGMRSVAVVSPVTGDFATGQRRGTAAPSDYAPRERRGWRLRIAVLWRD